MESILLFLPNLGGPEILLILLVILIFFGAKRIPDLARGMGRGIREFKDATREIKDEVNNAGNHTPQNNQTAPRTSTNTTGTTSTTSTNDIK
jgi:sec-independent protein translocase protein TatA